MNASAERFRQFLAMQRAEYGRTLPGKAAQADALWQAGDDLEALQRLAHTVYGSAGTYGFAAVGQAAREVEDAVLALRQAAAADVGALRARVEAALSAFRTSVPEAQSPQGPEA